MQMTPNKGNHLASAARAVATLTLEGSARLSRSKWQGFGLRWPCAGRGLPSLEDALSLSGLLAGRAYTVQERPTHTQGGVVSVRVFRALLPEIASKLPQGFNCCWAAPTQYKKDDCQKPSPCV